METKYIFVIFCLAPIVATLPLNSGTGSSCPSVIGPNRTCTGVGLYTDPKDCSIFITCLKGPQGIKPYVNYCARNFSFNGLECIPYEGEMPRCYQEGCRNKLIEQTSSEVMEAKSAIVGPIEHQGNVGTTAPGYNVTAKTITVLAASITKPVYNNACGFGTMNGSFWVTITIVLIHLVWNINSVKRL